MSLQGKIEAIIYAAEEPVTLEQLAILLKRDVLVELEAQSSATAPLDFVLAESSSEQEQVPQDRSDQTPASDPPEAPTGTSTGSEEPSEARRHPERAPESEEPLSPPESLSASVTTAAAVAPKKKKTVDPELARVKVYLRGVMVEVIESYMADARGVEVRQIAGGYRMATKPEHHDLVRTFAKSLKPPIKLSLQALETLAIIAYKQPVTAPEIADIRGVDSGGVLGTLLDRKLITTAGRKQVIGRPMQYKTTKEFLLRFGMNDLNELPSMEEFEKLAQEQTDMFSRDVPPETGPGPEEAEVESEIDAGYEAAIFSAAKNGEKESEPQRPPSEPEEPADAGDISSGADTSETIVREQLENEGKR